ncbi:IS1380 family transposase [Amycolatopsis balhimycina DSM 5908]|uniref:IS1380 family transposase n=1 Tax=Amycolatopsis balhimycina DSM 5908 TaxID=1081091 RepID=A0A428WDR6_AMYBA|nr:IS1380 family transposase [Amycolatopsis balhimycina DSM 5908]
MMVVAKTQSRPGEDTYLVGSLRGGRPQVRVGTPDASLTSASGMAAVAELVERLGVVRSLDAAVGPIKQRDRGFGAGELLVGLAAAQVAGEDFLVGLDRRRADVAGQVLTPVPGLSSTTAAGLARRFTDPQWTSVEAGVASVTERMLERVPAARRKRLCRTVTVDLDASDVEVYGRKKRGVAYNYQGQRSGRPHVASWAEVETVLAAELLSGNDDPRASASGLLLRALAALPRRARQGRVRLRADAGYFAGELARVAFVQGVEFAIGAKRIAPLWRMLSGIAEDDWADAIDMDGAQVAVADYRPDWWPAKTFLLIRRVRLDVSQISADSRSRRRRTLHPGQQVLPLDELGDADAIYGYSFILTNIDVSTKDKVAAVEYWYRHRTTIENLFRDSKHGAALRHLPSGYAEVNTAWMWGALLATAMAAWLHQLTATEGPHGRLSGWGTRNGKAMIATLRHRLINIPARLDFQVGQPTLHLPPGHDLLAEILARLRKLPAVS